MKKSKFCGNYHMVGALSNEEHGWTKSSHNNFIKSYTVELGLIAYSHFVAHRYNLHS